MVLQELYNLIEDRKINGKDGSYTKYLFDKGTDKILKKIGEECTEVIIAAKEEDKAEIINEIGDLTYHLIVLMVEKGISIEEIGDELIRRTNKINNFKGERREINKL